MSASADVLAQAKVEIDLSAIPLGKNVSFSAICTPKLAEKATHNLHEITTIGYCQMARQTRLHPPPHRGRNQSSREHKVGKPARSPTRL